MPTKPRVLVPLANGFEEIEAVTIVDVLRRAEIQVVVAGLEKGPIKGAHGLLIVPDQELATIKAEEFDMIALPGGMPGAKHLKENPKVQEILKTMSAAGRYTAAICAAPMALGAAGLTKGRTATSYPGFGDEFTCGRYVEDRVVIDGKLITSRGPGTALEFALTLVEKLKGPAKARELADGMLANVPGRPLEASA